MVNNQQLQNFSGALKGLRDTEFLLTQKYREQQTRARRDGAHDQILIFERKMVTTLKKMGIPFFCHSCIRSADEQTELYVRGFSKAAGGKSPHNFGCAVDLVHSTKAWNITKYQWEVIGHIGKELIHRNGLEIRWGGDWSFYDPAHWELTHWKQLANNVDAIDL